MRPTFKHRSPAITGNSTGELTEPVVKTRWRGSVPLLFHASSNSREIIKMKSSTIGPYLISVIFPNRHQVGSIRIGVVVECPCSSRYVLAYKTNERRSFLAKVCKRVRVYEPSLLSLKIKLCQSQAMHIPGAYSYEACLTR